jgi:probable F420-dependent oxidoreductase
MQIGAVFPQLEIGNDPATIARWATEVERLGYRHILAYDHVVGANTDTRPGWRGYSHADSFHEVFVLFGYLAAVTDIVELVTGVLILPQRQTALVAKQAAEVAVLSGGRLRLGIGVGWNPVEYDVLGERFSDRGVRSEEQIQLLRELWADPSITFSGRWHRVDNAGINPLPPGGRIPIWIGGTAESVLRRVGRMADGWLPQGPPDAAAAARLSRIRDYAEEAGRTRDAVGFEARLTVADVPQDRWASYIGLWRELGATHLCVNTMGYGLPDPDAHLNLLERVIALTADDQPTATRDITASDQRY